MDDKPPRELRYKSQGIGGLQPFVPGQLITADDLNEIVSAIKDLNERLRELKARCP